VSIKIKNWENFQHYKNRKPPWIKLYRELLDNMEWRALSDFPARLLVELWLLAAENQGEIDLDSTALSWRLRLASNKLAKIDDALQELVTHGFITIASNMLAPCKQHAIPETERETEKRQSKMGVQAFLMFWGAYPRKAGKAQAKNSFKRHKCAEIVDQIIAALEWQAKTEQWTRDGGKYIPHASTWLNGRRWEDEPDVKPRPNSNAGVIL